MAEERSGARGIWRSHRGRTRVRFHGSNAAPGAPSARQAKHTDRKAARNREIPSPSLKTTRIAGGRPPAYPRPHTVNFHYLNLILKLLIPVLLYVSWISLKAVANH